MGCGPSKESTDEDQFKLEIEKLEEHAKQFEDAFKQRREKFKKGKSATESTQIAEPAKSLAEASKNPGCNSTEASNSNQKVKVGQAIDKTQTFIESLVEFNESLQEPVKKQSKVYDGIIEEIGEAKEISEKLKTKLEEMQGKVEEKTLEENETTNFDNSTKQLRQKLNDLKKSIPTQDENPQVENDKDQPLKKVGKLVESLENHIETFETFSIQKEVEGPITGNADEQTEEIFLPRKLVHFYKEQRKKEIKTKENEADNAENKTTKNEKLREIGDKLASIPSALNTFVGYVTLLTSDETKLPSKEAEDNDYQTLINVMDAMLKYTDASEKLATKLAQKGLIKTLTKLLKLFKWELGDRKLSFIPREREERSKHILNYALALLTNLSIPYHNRKHFMETNTIGTITEFVESSWSKTCAYLTMANIVDEKNGGMMILAHKRVLKFIIKKLKAASQKKSGRSEGFSAETCVKGMTKLASNNENSVAMVKNGVLDCLPSLMENEHYVKMTIKLLLALSFANKEELRRNKLIVHRLEQLEENKEKPELAKRASNCLFQLTESSAVSKMNKGKGHIMLSYSWANQEMVLKIKERLKENGYEVWIDVEKMKGDTYEVMANAVQQSAIVLVCLSHKYKISSNCRLEGEYAQKLEKKIIPLLLENQYQPDGWLGIIVGNNLYYDFSRSQCLDSGISQLLSALRSEKMTLGTMIKCTTIFSEDVPKWDDDTVKKWVEKQKNQQLHLDGKGNQEIDGKENQEIDEKTLIFLKNLKKEAPESFYRFMDKHFQISNPSTLIIFIEALSTIE